MDQCRRMCKFRGIPCTCDSDPFSANSSPSLPNNNLMFPSMFSTTNSQAHQSTMPPTMFGFTSITQGISQNADGNKNEAPNADQEANSEETSSTQETPKADSKEKPDASVYTKKRDDMFAAMFRGEMPTMDTMNAAAADVFAGIKSGAIEGVELGPDDPPVSTGSVGFKSNLPLHKHPRYCQCSFHKGMKRL
ncbi:uncharacterized protein [Chironomus tepperi]|uniref:uncharacterized protein n=1 Tax=Chironomus tepperi TaxID=113505 RepID=UPI00391F4AB0